MLTDHRGGVVIEVGDLAELTGLPSRQVRRWLIGRGAAEKRGGRWITTDFRLRERFPELLATIEEKIAAGHAVVSPSKHAPAPARVDDQGRVLIDACELAKVAGWPARTMRRRLTAAGALIKDGRRSVTTPELIALRFPEMSRFAARIDGVNVEPATAKEARSRAMATRRDRMVAFEMGEQHRLRQRQEKQSFQREIAHANH